MKRMPPSPRSGHMERSNRNYGQAPSTPVRRPSNFSAASPDSVNSLAQLGEGVIDELLSLGSANPMSFGSGAASMSEEWRLTNPVHMEVQENAKVPTFNWSVDRSGSAHPVQNPEYMRYKVPSDRAGGTVQPQQQRQPQRQVAHQPPSQQNDAPEEDDTSVNWSELFLQHNKRSVLNANYQRAGVLRQDTTKHVHPDPPARDTYIDLDLDVDPTPLSEIKRRVQQRQEEHFRQQSPPPDPSNAQATSRQPAQPQQPEANAKPQASVAANQSGSILSIADAVATAAALASQQQATVAPTKPPPPRTGTMSSTVPLAVTAGRPRPTWTVPNARKHTQARMGSKSRYGFGSNHVVPSVPAAPPLGSAAATNRARNPITTAPSFKPTPVTSAPSSLTAQPVLSNAVVGGKSTEAYERKKQRAKDARVKLNDSIDRLSISINLAGSQSKHRLGVLQKMPAALSPACMQITQECVRTAETARKWDRPSFVGTAAALIQGLNAQCESLMRELAAAQEQQPRNGVQNGVASREKRSALMAGSHSHKRPRTNNGAFRVPSTITVKTEAPPVDATPPDGSILTPRLMERVFSFLDPKSVVRCRLVSKSWKRVGSENRIWEGLAVSRFGFFSLRQWRERLDDEDVQDVTPVISLYKSMDARNVMPHFQHDGMILLGEARLPGAVSAWTFLVERSNGETLRSVRRQPNMTGTGIYVSLPVIELRTVVQNTGVASLVLGRQTQAVDSSTRRRGGEMKEIDWDDRFRKRITNLSGSARPSPADDILCRLNLFDVVVIETYIYAKGCSTTSKFVQRSNFTKLLLQIRNGVTSPLVIPFTSDTTRKN